MLRAGDKIRFVTDPKGRDILTIEAVSPYIAMVRVDGCWTWVDSVVLIEAAPVVAEAPATPRRAEQLSFLGM